MRELNAFTDRELEIALIKARLRQSWEDVRKELDASPCRYRGCDMFAWCETCNGWHEGCNARRPEALYHNR